MQDASQAGRYVAKWGIGEEMTLTDRKKARRGGSTPFELMAEAHDGDERAKGLYIEYLRASPQINVLRWSRGLKDLVGVGEVTDADAAQDEKQDEQVETGRANIPHGVWRVSVASPKNDQRAALLDKAEEVGALAAVDEMLQYGLEVDEIAELLDEIDVPPAPMPGGLRERLVSAVTGRHPPTQT